MPELQKALVLPTPAGPHEVQSISRPELAPGQVLVKVIAAALNPADWKMQDFKTWPDSYPIIFGFDGAGEVEEVSGDITDFSKGDRVIFQGWRDEDTKLLHGTFQQYVAIPTYILAKIPRGVSFTEGATLFTGIATSANPLYSHKPGTESLRLSPPWEDGRDKYAGKSALIIGGAAQIGLFAIQFAKLSGFNPIITVASAHSAPLLKLYGATHVVDRKLSREDTIAEVRSILAGGLVDLVYDAISEDSTLALAAAAVREGGQAVFVAPGQEGNLKKIFEARGVEWVIARGMLSSERNKGALAGLWRKLPDLLEEGALKPTKYKLLGGLEAVPGGLDQLRRNEVSGVKLVVHPQDTQ
ncbi:GroES-like protein [Lentinus tigrinus ALCF2SS1-7]|uniref:GroES-like protein n=1 Tax=Lentinus tigrinus ALCF2SS1-6 TaxID=1328759 RepID=A0A5C2RQR1_9APHY|nr:GroES-like protein [Lentinus tigrinus ALCF2SS1-6]RPD76796.1 GroES-like protein [Lentinus tigrinus ALCF2SS1-7]